MVSEHVHQVAICETTSKAPSRFGRILASNELYLTERQTQKQSSQQPSAGHFPFSARVNRSHRHMTCTFEHKSRTSHICVEACKVCARLCPGESLLGEITTNDHRHRRPAAAGGRMLECCQQRTTTTIHSHYIRMRRRQSHRARFAIFVTKYERPQRSTLQQRRKSSGGENARLSAQHIRLIISAHRQTIAFA